MLYKRCLPSATRKVVYCGQYNQNKVLKDAFSVGPLLQATDECSFNFFSYQTIGLNLWIFMCSVWLWFGSEWLLREEWPLPLPAGLPEASRDALQQLWRVCGRRGGHSPGKDIPHNLLRVHHLQVIVKKQKTKTFRKIDLCQQQYIFLTFYVFLCVADSLFLLATVSPSVEKTACVSAVVDLCLLLLTTAVPVVSAFCTFCPVSRNT